jgi:hypothetical protein
MGTAQNVRLYLAGITHAQLMDAVGDRQLVKTSSAIILSNPPAVVLHAA